MTDCPILFVDFDGVLLTADRQRELGSWRLDPEKVALLDRLARDLDAQIVVTSAWRTTLGRMRELLATAGLRNARRRVVGITPRFYCGVTGQPVDRGIEIESWIKGHFRLGVPLAILDDDADMGLLASRLVQTDYRVGLTETDCQRVRDLLTRITPSQPS